MFENDRKRLTLVGPFFTLKNQNYENFFNHITR